MERRRNNRFSADKYVGIEYPGGRTFAGRTRDLSFGGLFVELDMTDLPAHGLVQLLVPIEDEEIGSCLRIPVAITRHSREGIGLLYCGYVAHSSPLSSSLYTKDSSNSPKSAGCSH
jgi:hypothetical protein